MPPALGICATEQLGVKTIDEDWTETDTDTKQAQKSSCTNYIHSQVQTHTPEVFHSTQKLDCSNGT